LIILERIQRKISFKLKIKFILFVFLRRYYKDRYHPGPNINIRNVLSGWKEIEKGISSEDDFLN
jgi:hypothetical protein